MLWKEILGTTHYDVAMTQVHIFAFFSIVKKDFEPQVRAQTSVFFGGHWVKL